MIIYISGDLTNSPKKQSELVASTNYLIALGVESKNIISIQDSLLTMPTDYLGQLEFRFNLLSQCDVIYMLTNWKDSIESRHELTYAMENGLEIYYENTPFLPILSLKPNSENGIS